MTPASLSSPISERSVIALISAVTFINILEFMATLVGGLSVSFMSMQSSIQHMAAAAGAFLSAQILVEGADHKLLNIATLGWISIAIASALPPLLFMVERGVRARPADAVS